MIQVISFKFGGSSEKLNSVSYVIEYIIIIIHFYLLCYNVTLFVVGVDEHSGYVSSLIVESWTVEVIVTLFVVGVDEHSGYVSSFTVESWTVELIVNFASNS